MRKKVDDRIHTLIQNGANARHRSLFVVIGDKGRDQVVNLHYLLSKAVVKARPTVLWCYSDRLEISRFPLPSECNLYHVDPDTLFSFHKESEIFLQRMMAIYVASHYKNSPDDLQLMADAPDQNLFVLLGPVDDSQNVLPEILCVIQVCMEGNISRNYELNCLERGYLQRGNQIPQKFYEYLGI